MHLKLRPIFARHKHPTSKPSSFIDILLKRFLKNIPSYIKESLNFLSTCQRETEQETVNSTLGIASISTSISNDLGVQSIYYFLSNFSNDLNRRFLESFVIEVEEFDFLLKKRTHQWAQ